MSEERVYRGQRIEYIPCRGLDLKLLLIQPPIRDFYDTDVRLQPIGLSYLKAAVRKHLPDIDVSIKDYHSGCGRRTVALPEELQYVAEYYSTADRSPFSTFHNYYHFGRSFDEIENELAEIDTYNAPLFIEAVVRLEFVYSVMEAV